MNHEAVFPILAKFNRVEWPSPNQGNCQCPVHQDDKNSIQLGIEGNQLLLTCLAGCDTASILMATNSLFSDLFAKSPDKPKKSRGKIVATYDYRDAGGEVVHQTVRMDPKQFWQRRPSHEGETVETKSGVKKAKRDHDGNWWLWTLAGSEPVLYRLPEILERPDDPIFQAEGEKDCDNLSKAFGVLTTTNPMGASKWRDSYSEQLRGRTVYLIPDVDKPGKNRVTPGQKHVLNVAASLHSIAAEVKILDLPALGLTPKWDVSDWLKKGGTKEMLFEAVERAKVFDPSEHADETATEITNAISELDSVRPLPMKEITGRILKATGDWPRRVGSTLFVHEGERILYLDGVSQFFGWLGHRIDKPPKFVRNAGCYTKDEVVSNFKQFAQVYDSVETLPHEPPITTCYYAHGEFKPTEGSSALKAFVDRFNPATPEDADLIICFLATLFWGGPAGARPAFVLTSDDGRGAGKSKLAQFAAKLAGGAIEISSNEDASIMRQRLLSPEGMTRRIAMLDNVKSWKFSLAELEALITAEIISGKRMYVGEGSRPNLLTWILTLNGVSLSTDMAQRCVIIKLKRPSSDGDWLEDTDKLFAATYREIIGDLLAVIRGPRSPLTRHTRWSRWERDILGLCGDPDRVQDMIIARQAESDVEVSESDLIEEHFRTAIDNAGYKPDDVKLFLPSSVAAEWLNAALDERHSKVAAGRMLNQRIDEGSIRQMVRSKDNSKRGVVWIGKTTNSITATQDLVLKQATLWPRFAAWRRAGRGARAALTGGPSEAASIVKSGIEWSFAVRLRLANAAILPGPSWLVA